MRRGEYGLLVALASVWGLSYVFYRVGAPVLGPALFVELRVLTAGGVLAAYLAAGGGLGDSWRRIRGQGREYLILGALNAAIPFTLIAFGELTLPASFASVLNATAPLFSSLLGVPLLGQPISGRQSSGIAAGILGVAVAVGAAPFALSFTVVLAVAVTLIAAFSYGLGAIFVQRRLRAVRPTDLALGLQVASAALVAPFAAVEIPVARFTLPGVEAVLGIALLSTALAYVIYFHILQSSGPTQALTVTFLMPIFGVVWGFLLLGEALGVGLLAGIAAILVGVGLVTSRAGGRAPARAGAHPTDRAGSVNDPGPAGLAEGEAKRE
jgi:drug/metabolite transporter (DMT)-like permease